MDKVKKDLVLLNMVQGVGYLRIKALLDEFKTTQAILNAPLEKLLQIKGIGRNIAESIRKAGSDHDIDKEISLVEESGITIITAFDKEYPASLKQIYDPPVVLYIKGELRQEDAQAVAIVGSRRCSQYGIRTAKRLAGELSESGITVVSGLARGIDTAAHRGAISAKGRTIAVLGNGLSSIYPYENKTLADDIIKNGALISEFPMDMPPHKENFPRRNRIISGLAKGVVVVEAGEKSGALITADFALEEGREVFAVPGCAGQAVSKGTNNLIKDGAKLVEDAEDILTELGIKGQYTKNDEKLILDDTSEGKICKLVSDEPIDIDNITETLSMQLSQVKTALLKLTMRGIVKELPGKLYVRAK